MLAVIPARGGSKGVPNKNIKTIAGRPLLSYSIRAAEESGLFDKIIVSTDSREIAEIARQWGAEVPFIRPTNLSGDKVASDDVILHALDFFKEQGIEYDTVCKLQPTSPLRTAKHISDAFQLMQDTKADYVVSVCECEHSPKWCGLIGENLVLDNFITEEAKRSCRQDIETYYRLNGAIYFGRVEKFILNKSFLGVNSKAYIMRQQDSIDIDTALDFKIAEIIINC